MKRSIMASILGCILLVITLFACSQTSTKAKDQKTQTPGKVQEGPSKNKSDWKTLRVDGVEITVIRLFTKRTCPDEKETDPGKKRIREVAILDLSDTQYKDFVRAPEAFVNKYDIFSCRVTGKLEHARRTAKTATPPPSSDPRVTVYHDPDCGGIYYP